MQACSASPQVRQLLSNVRLFCSFRKRVLKEICRAARSGNCESNPSLLIEDICSAISGAPCFSTSVRPNKIHWMFSLTRVGGRSVNKLGVKKAVWFFALKIVFESLCGKALLPPFRVSTCAGAWTSFVESFLLLQWFAELHRNDTVIKFTPHSCHSLCSEERQYSRWPSRSHYRSNAT